MNRKGIAVIALFLCFFGLYLSGAMISFYFGMIISQPIQDMFKGLLVPILVWIGSIMIGAYGIYELTKD